MIVNGMVKVLRGRSEAGPARRDSQADRRRRLDEIEEQQAEAFLAAIRSNEIRGHNPICALPTIGSG